MFRFPLLIAIAVVAGSFASKVEADATSYLQSKHEQSEQGSAEDLQRDQKDMKEAVTLMQPCKTEKDKEGAIKTCAKHLKDQESNDFNDCVFDVCAGETDVVSIELAAESTREGQ
mmetsp:Transcript_1662/g.2910  ORF Transcript_1662/g.2910 Transcript_1662/m.2910 type:complete len:115 (-) Transcript_1662:93-437(-)